MWRYRFVTLPIIALTLIGAFYVIAVKAPEYKVSSSYVLINPPPPPTADDIARNPALGRINPNNPYTRFSDQSVIVSLLSSSLSADAARQQLVNEGADPRYTVSPDLQLGYSSLVVQVEGVGSTPEAAVHTAQLVGAALAQELDRVQASQGVDPHYRIKTQEVVAPNSPTQQLSSTLRPLVGILAIGAILLLLGVSAAEALETLRAEWGERDLSKGGADEIRSMAPRTTTGGMRARSLSGGRGARCDHGQAPERLGAHAETPQAGPPRLGTSARREQRLAPRPRRTFRSRRFGRCGSRFRRRSGR